MIKKKSVVDFYQLPKNIQEHLKLMRDWNGNGSYAEIDVMSDKDKTEWLTRVSLNDEYVRRDCAVSDYFRSEGVKPGVNAVVVLRTW